MSAVQGSGIRAGLFVEQRGELWQDCAGDDFGTLDGGVDSVLLDGARDVDEIFVDHGDEGDVMFSGKVAEDLVEGLDVVRAVIRRKGDASEEHLDVCGFEGGEDCVEILLRLIGGQSAEAVVAAEFDDNEGRVSTEDRIYIGGCVLGGGAAGASIFNFVFVATLVEIALKRIRERLARLESIPCGDTVAVADDQGPVGRDQGK